MKTAIAFAGLMILGMGLAIYRCAGEDLSNAGTQLKSFAVEKEHQAQSLANSMDVDLPPDVQPFFSAIQVGNWESATNSYFKIKDLVLNGRLFHRSWWQPVVETYGAEEQFRGGGEKYFTAYANDIIPSIPPGSIYFGGTDPGRFIISAMEKSQIKGDPFFTLTQNELADGTYLDYLRSMYGDKIYIPTVKDSQNCFNNYYEDVQRRRLLGQLEPGESVTTDPNTGQMQVSGQVAVMNINALIVKVIFDHETNREFYIEESFPLAWMYPYLEPHGLIFKLNREPLPKLSDDVIQRDHDYWTKTVSPMIGDWLNDNTPVSDVAAFNEKVSLQHDFSGFTGDTNFVLNSYANKMFSKVRSSSAGMYAWRAQHTTDPGEKERMSRAADFAFRQSWALCPGSPEAVFRYVQFLMQTNRIGDALIIAKTSLKMDPQNTQILDLINNLQKYKASSGQREQAENQLSTMENEARTNPTDYKNIFLLAGYYLQLQQTNRASQLLLQTVSRPNVPVEVLRRAASFFAQAGDFRSLETTLKKTASANPQTPEIWYDLARLEARLGKDDDAIKNLQTAINLSDVRLQTNPGALDIRNAAQNAADFNSIRSSPDFQKLISQ